MTCAEIQDRMWDEPDACRPHADACAACAEAMEKIRAIRGALRPEAEPADLLGAGVLARLSRPAPRWPGVLRYAAGILIGLLAALPLALRPEAREPEIRIVRPDPPCPELNRVLSTLGNDPGLEREMIRILNEALRRRSDSAERGEPMARKEVTP